MEVCCLTHFLENFILPAPGAVPPELFFLSLLRPPCPKGRALLKTAGSHVTHSGILALGIDASLHNSGSSSNGVKLAAISSSDCGLSSNDSQTPRNCLWAAKGGLLGLTPAIWLSGRSSIDSGDEFVGAKGLESI